MSFLRFVEVSNASSSVPLRDGDYIYAYRWGGANTKGKIDVIIFYDDESPIAII